MSDDFRAALAELLQATESYSMFTDAETTTAMQRATRLDDAIKAAHTLLARSQSKPAAAPTHEQLREFVNKWWGEFVYQERGANVATPVIDIIHPSHLTDFLRDGLARWGHPVAELVPVAERLPGPEHCTVNPRTGYGEWCWGWVQHDPYCHLSPTPYSGRWRMMPRAFLKDEARFWLPYWALPMPGTHELNQP